MCFGKMVFVLVTILFINHTVTDNFLNQVLSLSELGPVPKYWHKYVQYFVHNSLKRLSTSLHGTTELWYHLARQANTFASNVFLREYFIDLCKVSVLCRNKRIVKRASGTLLASTTQCGHCTPGPKVSDSRRCHWYFESSTSLGLNVTFVSISFFFEHLSCSIGYLSVLQTDFIITQRLLKFCGIYAGFNVYLNHQKIWVETCIAICFNIFVHAEYMSMDRYVISSTHKETCYQGSTPVEHSVILHLTDQTVQSYFISVVKTSVVVLKLVGSCALSVHDVPDVYSESVQPHRGFYQMSTFQCFVAANVSKSSMCYVFFDKEVHCSIMQLSEERTNISLPNDHWTVPNCVSVYVASSPLHQVNATLRFFSIAPHVKSPNCRHGGFAVLDNNLNHTEISTVCENKSKSSLYHSFYSSNSTLAFVVYWYTKEVPKSVDLILSTTECKSVTIDLCFFQRLTRVWGFCQKHIDAAQNKVFWATFEKFWVQAHVFQG